MPKPRARIAMQQRNVPLLFGAADRARLESLCEIDMADAVTDWSTQTDASLADVEVVLTGWGTPPITRGVLDRMPRLRAVAHAGGGIGPILSATAWDRGVAASTAGLANARPVAEYTVAAILMAGKQMPWIARRYRAEQSPIDREQDYPAIGNFGRTVGIVGASRTGRIVIELLRPFDVDVLVSDPFLSPEEAASLGVTAVSLTELAERSSILSIHAPAMPETDGLVSAEILAALPDDATVINTARGTLIDQVALLRELDAGRLYAILDVTDPEEPLPPGHPLYTHPRAVLTPHLAGSAGNELGRMGRSVVDELERWADGRGFAHPATRAESMLP